MRHSRVKARRDHPARVLASLSSHADLTVAVKRIYWIVYPRAIAGGLPSEGEGEERGSRREQK